MIQYQHVVEVGAGDGHSTEGLRWAVSAERVTLYEPHPLLWADLTRAAAGFTNVTVVNEAVTSHFDPLYLMGYASFLRGNPSFLATSVEPEGIAYWEPLAREVSCQKVDRIDYGTIDYLILTVNGAELDILKGLVSRPKVIRTKHYLHNARQHAAAQEVFNWFYRARYVGRTLSTNQHQTFFHVEWTHKALDTTGQPT